MEITNNLPDTNNTIKHLTELIDLLNPNWIQKLVMDIYLNDIQETSYKRGIN